MISNRKNHRRKPSISFFVVLFTLCSLLTHAADTTNEPYPMKLELHLEDYQIPAYGILIGELIFKNAGNKLLRFDGVMSIESHTGRLEYELETPHGKTEILRKSSMGDIITRQWSELRPGEYAIHPICLLKLNNKYIFSKESVYRIRAIYKTLFLRAVGQKLDPTTHPPVVKSDWAEFTIGPVGRGRAKYLNSHPWSNLYRAFSRKEGLAHINNNLDTYFDYQHEQEKLLVYQLVTPGLLREVAIHQKFDEQLIVDAKQGLARAKRFGTGVQMWEWIVARLEGVSKYRKRTQEVYDL